MNRFFSFLVELIYVNIETKYKFRIQNIVFIKS